MRRTISHGNGATIHSLSKAEPAKTWNGAPVRGIDTHSFGLLRSNCISRTYVSTQSLYTATIYLHHTPIFVCTYIHVYTEECRTLKEPEHGTIHYSIMDDTIYAQLQCSGGYVITGCAVTTCSGSTGGTWEQEIPHCRGWKLCTCGIK